MDVERLIADALISAGYSAYYDVPADRPSQFVTVQQTGGDVEAQFLARPEVAVDCWDVTRRDAALFASDVADVIAALKDDDPDVFGVDIQTEYRDDDIDTDTPKRALNVTLTIAI